MQLKQKLAIGYFRAYLKIISLLSPVAAARKALELFFTPMGRSGQELPALFSRGSKLEIGLEGLVLRGHQWLPAEHVPNSGKRALIAHGWQSSARNFEQYIDALLGKGYEVIAFDGPAHGISDGKRITLPMYIKMLEMIAQQYGPIHSYMGHSFGGLALTLLLEDRSAEASSRLALIAPACEAVTAADTFFSTLRLGPAVRRAFDELGRDMAGHAFTWFSIRRAMQKLSIPVLWVQDEDDVVTPLRDAQLVWGDGHPTIEVLVTKGLGHRAVYRDPAVQRRVVDFLTVASA